jgi:type IV secretion system pilin
MMLVTSLLSRFAACGGGSFLGFPAWYSYLPASKTVNGICAPQLRTINDVWLIVAAIIEILLRVAALVAVVYVILGGFSYITSQGDPSKTAKARDTIISALAGLTVAVVAASLIGFIAGRIT